MFHKDDDVLILCNVHGKKVYRARRNIIKMIEHIGFNIDIETNLKVIDFSDITFNLNNGTCKLYKNKRFKVIHQQEFKPPS